MACYLAVDENGTELISDKPLERWDNEWVYSGDDGNYVNLPKGTIKKIIGRTLTWLDEPVEIVDE